MAEPHPNLGGFISFANATDRSRGTVVKRIREQSSAEYSPVTDFWKRMRDAVKTDRRTTRDGEAVYAAAVNATDKKRESYSRVANKWQLFLPRWADSDFEKPHTGVMSSAGLSISVVPRFVEAWSSGERERTFVYFNAMRLSSETLDTALRVMQLAYPESDDATPVLLDVQRGQAHRSLTQPRVIVDKRIERLSGEFMDRWAA